MAFAQIYICPIHGETWHPVSFEEIDTERDAVWTEILCNFPGCTRSVMPLMHEGKYVMHALTENELRDEMALAWWEEEDNDD
jgi:hypothetical protein